MTPSFTAPKASTSDDGAPTKRCRSRMNVTHLYRPHVLFLRLRRGSGGGTNHRLRNSLDVMRAPASFNSESSLARQAPRVNRVLKFWRCYATAGLGFIRFDSSTLASPSVGQTLIRWAKTNSFPLKKCTGWCAFAFFMTKAALSWYYVLPCDIYRSQHI